VEIMNLSAPKQTTFIIAVVVALLGLFAAIVPLGSLTGMALWLILLGFIVLAAGCLLPNL
jgi:threonine/homoserine/homoserine lactone efflux protein